jgi:hypothetical protein
MPSYISNSSDRLPIGNWGRGWLVTAVVVLAVFGTFELTLRQLGHCSQTVDNERSWMLARSRVKDGDRRQWVLLGSSKIVCDVDLDTLGTLIEDRPVQLGVAGSSCLPSLEHLAGDEGFSGVVICELLPGLLSWSAGISQPYRQLQYVRLYEDRSADTLLEARLRTKVASEFVFLQPRFGIWWLARGLARGEFAAPSDRIEFLANRSVRMYFDSDFTMAEDELHANLEIARKRITDVRVVDETIDHLRRQVSKIRARGGKVIFCRFPSTGHCWILESTAYPRKQEWNRLAKDVGAPCLHFADDSELREFHCPDGSHLDARDSERFTRVLHARIMDLLRSDGTQ